MNYELLMNKIDTEAIIEYLTIGHTLDWKTFVKGWKG